MTISTKALFEGRYECSYPECSYRTNQSHRLCSFHKKMERDKENARKKIVAEIELDKEKNKPIKRYSKNGMKRKEKGTKCNARILETTRRYFLHLLLCGIRYTDL